MPSTSEQNEPNTVRDSGAIEGGGAHAAESRESLSPLVYFTARRPWHILDPRELWRHRELCRMLGKRDLQVRYRQTLVGLAWCLLQPLTSMAIFATLFGLLGRRPAVEGLPYPLILLTGIVPWQMFASVVSQSTGSLVANQGMITKAYFPRLVLPLATAIPAGVDFAISSILLMLALPFFNCRPTPALVAAPLFAALIMLTALAVGIWLSALNATYRDIQFVVPFMLQVGFFASPVVYQVEALIPQRWQLLLWLNPLTGLLEGFRWAVLADRPFPTGSLVFSLCTLSVVLLTGLVYFQRVERSLADRI